MGLLLLGIVMAVVPNFLSLGEKYFSNKQEKKRNGWVFVGIIVTVIGLFLSLYSGCDSKRKQEKAEKKAESLQNLMLDKTDSIKTISTQLSNSSDTVKRLAYKIINIQDNQMKETSNVLKSENINLNRQIEILKEITGNNNKPIISAEAYSQYEQHSAWVLMYLQNNSKYPIDNLSVQIHEINVYSNDTTYTIKGIVVPPNRKLSFLKVISAEPDFIKKYNFSYWYQVIWPRGSYSGQFEFYRDNKGLPKYHVEQYSTSWPW